MRSICVTKPIHCLVHKLVDATRIPSRTIWDMQRLHIVIVHLDATDIDVCLQVALELLAAAVIDVRVRPCAQLAPADEVALPGVRIHELLQHKKACEALNALNGPLEYLDTILIMS